MFKNEKNVFGPFCNSIAVVLRAIKIKTLFYVCLQTLLISYLTKNMPVY
jgi:hypothetical protein